MFYDEEKIKIIHQGLDTFVIGVKILDEIVYNSKFKPFLSDLYNLKEEAKKINSYGEKYIQSDLGLDLGIFLVSSKGIQNYKYLFKNNDIFVSVSDSKISTKSMYHFKIQFRSHFLLRFGMIKSYDFVKELLNRLLGFSSMIYEVKILRLDLCCDITGIKYTPQDIFKFRSLRKVTNYSENFDSDDNLLYDDEKSEFDNFDKIDVNSFIRFSRFQGLSFGKSPAMFRVYDKIKEVSQKGIAPLIFYEWKNNGFDIDNDKFVFRHECEFGRAFIKKLIPYKCFDEIGFFFDNVNSFWLKGLELCRWYPLEDTEVLKILKNASDNKGATNRKIYERCLKDNSRFHFWDKLCKWDDEKLKDIRSKNLPFIPNIEKPKKALKAFLTSVYVNLGYDGAFYDVLKSVTSDLAKDDLTPHDYGMMKLASHFVDNEKLTYTSDFNNEKLRNIFNDNIVEFMLMLDELDNKDYNNVLKKSLNFYDKYRNS